MRAAVVGVKVLVHIKNEVGGRAVRIGDFLQGGEGAVGDEELSGRVVVSGEEDDLRGCAGLADRGYGGLDAGGPRLDIGDCVVSVFYGGRDRTPFARAPDRFDRKKAYRHGVRSCCVMSVLLSCVLRGKRTFQR